MRTSPACIKRELCGYSFVEVLVVIFIMITVFALGIANFRSFGYRKEIDRVTDDAMGKMKLARQYALTGKKENCDVLWAWGFRRVNDTKYAIQEMCNIDDTEWYPEETITLPDAVRIEYVGNYRPSNPFQKTVAFYALGNGSNADTSLNSAKELRIRFYPTNHTFSYDRIIVVYPSGEISYLP